MNSRGYNKRFDLYETTTESDGFGGYKGGVPVLLANCWANITTYNPGSRNNNTTDFGVLDANNALLIKVRKRNDITYDSTSQYIVYRGEKYLISTDPTNVNFNDNQVQFIATKASTKAINNLSTNPDLNSNLNTQM